MTPKSLKHYERLLLVERARALDELQDAELDLQGRFDAPENEPEAQDHMDMVSGRIAGEAGAAIAERQSRELERIDEALRTLYRSPERFGRCEVCGGQIASARLELLPTTRRCAHHARHARYVRHVRPVRHVRRPRQQARV